MASLANLKAEKGLSKFIAANKPMQNLKKNTTLPLI